MDIKQLTGYEGEAVAARYLKKKGYTILAQNVSCRFGEIDLIAQNLWYVVFVEVKTRTKETFASAREYVTREKQNRIRKTAMMWLLQNETTLQPRFDVIEIIGHGEKRKINHIENAF